MKKITILILISFALFAYMQCSTDKNPLPSTAHPEGWTNPDADDFHGTKVLEIGYSSCKACHGAELSGGRTGKSCFGCHSTYPHSESWVAFGDENNHGNQIKNNAVTIDKCKECHGTDLKGGESGVSCFDCHETGSLP